MTSDRNPLKIYNTALKFEAVGESIPNSIMCYKLAHEKNRLTYW
jgi:hypothetical protein